MTMTPRLSVKHLQVLAAFRRMRNLSRIAEVLKLTPSAVSRRIDEAEARLGFALFTKASNRIQLTPAGEHILQSAERILADLDRAENVASHLDKNVRHVIRIGMSIYQNFGWFPLFDEFLQRTLPDVRLEITADTSGDELEALKSGMADLIITPLTDDVPGTTRVGLFTDELVAIVAPSHRLAKRRFLSPADVEPEDYYTYSMSVTPGFEYLEFLKPAHVRPRRYILVGSPEAAASAARGGRGMSILSRWATRSDVEDGRVCALSLSQRGVHVTWSAVLLKSTVDGSVSEDVAQQLKAFFARPRRRPAPKSRKV